MISTTVAVVGDVPITVTVRGTVRGEPYVSIKIGDDTHVSLDLAIGAVLRDALTEVLAVPVDEQDTEVSA